MLLSIYKVRAWHVKNASIKKLMHNKKGLSTGLTKRYRNLKKRLVEAVSRIVKKTINSIHSNYGYPWNSRVDIFSGAWALTLLGTKFVCFV